MAGKRYHSVNREAIVNWFKKHEGQITTIGTLDQDLADGGMPIAKATLYRIVAELRQEGFLRTVSEAGKKRESYVYQRDTGGSLLQCQGCGKMMAMHCREIDKFSEHIAQEHNFLIDQNNTIFVGYCSDCDQESQDQRGRKG